jgi:hypothetical protein
MAKTLKELLEARFVSSGAFRMSASGRKIRRRIKIGDDDYNKEDDLDKDGDVDKDDAKLSKRVRWESFSAFSESKVPERMQGKQKPYVSSDGKGNFEVLGNKGQTKATFNRSEHGHLAHGKAQAHLRAKYDEYMKESLDEAISSGNAQHALANSEHGKHAAYMKQTHGVETKYHGTDELSYHGDKASVKKALINHYDDEDEAKALHPKVFKEAYSMDDLRKDAADHLKKSIDKQSDDRIAALKNPPKKKGFFARVGEKQINMVKGAYHGLTKEDTDKGEYDYEGQMARTQLQTIVRNATDLVDMLEDDENMPEWVQSKITLAQDYITCVRDYLQSKEELGEETNIEEGVFTDDEGIAKKLVAKYGKNVQSHDIKLALHLHPEGHKTTVDRVAGHVKKMLSVKEQTELEEKRGLWDNIHAKRDRIKNGSGEKMRKPGSKGAPTATDFKDSQSVKEESIVEHDEHGPDHVEIALDHRTPPKNQKAAMATLKAHGAEYVATSDKATHFKVHKDKAYRLSKELRTHGVESDINEGLKHHIAAAAIAVAGALGGHAHAQSHDTQKTADKPAATASVDSDKSPHDGGSKAEHQARIDKAVADGSMSRGDANVEKMKHGLRPSFGRIKLNQESTEQDPPFDKPYKTVPPVTKDKSGAEHTGMSRARHIARLAMKQAAKKAKA